MKIVAHVDAVKTDVLAEHEHHERVNTGIDAPIPSPTTPETTTPTIEPTFIPPPPDVQ